MGKSKTKPPPMAWQPGPGRKAVDWGLLQDLWIISGKPKRDFLGQYGISLASTHTRAQVAKWGKEVNVATKEAARLRLEQRAQSDKTLPQEDGGLWQFVMQMRKGQAGEDWKTAQAVRQHVKMIIQQATTHEPGQTPRTTLNSRELCNLAEALERIQKIQRLALGMSTENIGIDHPNQDDDGPAIDQTQEYTGPVFVVEVSDSGKFKRARPRQIA